MAAGIRFKTGGFYAINEYILLFPINSFSVSVASCYYFNLFLLTQFPHFTFIYCYLLFDSTLDGPVTTDSCCLFLHYSVVILLYRF